LFRRVSCFGAPFWLAYHLACAASGPASGNVMTMGSISIAILRYDVQKEKNTE